MPRQPRIDLPGVPQHLVQRGNERRPGFFAPIDRRPYLDELRDGASRHGCAVHAYVLMTNHVHLRLTPAAIGCVSALMQAPGRRYVRDIDDGYRRTGTLWEGRSKAFSMQSDDYPLRCDRYIELSPIRARVVGHPSAYAWSGYAANPQGATDLLVSPHRQYLALDAEDTARQRLYREWVKAAITPDEIDEIRRRLQCHHAFGTERFRHKIEEQLRRRLGSARMG